VDGVTIRQAEPADAPALARLHVAAWRWAYAGLVPGGYLAALDPAPRETIWMRRLASDEGRGHVAVAVDGDALVGFAAWGRYHLDDLGPADAGAAPPSGAALPSDAVGEVRALYLAQAYQGRGVGRALMAWAVGHLAAEGYTEAKLWVLETNALARRFYERQGWAPDGGHMVEDYDGLALPEVRYGRSL
jgi:GNAT superfamily N-acetyltransferase